MTTCPHCGEAGNHDGLEICPNTGSRMPRVAVSPGGSDSPMVVDGEGASVAQGAVESNEAGRDPFAAFEQPWRLEYGEAEPLGLADGDSLVIGRDTPGPIGLVCGDTISRRHISIEVNQGNLLATDLNSLNGSFLNGSQLEAGVAMPCSDGDQLRLASEEPLLIHVRRNQG